MTRVSIYLSKIMMGTEVLGGNPSWWKKSLQDAKNKIKKAKTKANHRMNIKWYDSVKGGDVD